MRRWNRWLLPVLTGLAALLAVAFPQRLSLLRDGWLLVQVHTEVLAAENDTMRGLWTGTFQETEAGCAIVFTEDVTAKKALLRPFVRGYLKRQQHQYLEDLRSALGL